MYFVSSRDRKWGEKERRALTSQPTRKFCARSLLLRIPSPQSHNKNVGGSATDSGTKIEIHRQSNFTSSCTTIHNDVLYTSFNCFRIYHPSREMKVSVAESIG